MHKPIGNASKPTSIKDKSLILDKASKSFGNTFNKYVYSNFMYSNCSQLEIPLDIFVNFACDSSKTFMNGDSNDFPDIIE